MSQRAKVRRLDIFLLACLYFHCQICLGNEVNHHPELLPGFAVCIFHWIFVVLPKSKTNKVVLHQSYYYYSTTVLNYSLLEYIMVLINASRGIEVAIPFLFVTHYYSTRLLLLLESTQYVLLEQFLALLVVGYSEYFSRGAVASCVLATGTLWEARKRARFEVFILRVVINTADDDIAMAGCCELKLASLQPLCNQAITCKPYTWLSSMFQQDTQQIYQWIVASSKKECALPGSKT